MTAIIKEEKNISIRKEFDTTIIAILDISNFPIPAEIYITDNDIAW